VARNDAYGYVDGVLKPIGLLLENAATNLVEQSGDLTQNEWAIWGSEVNLSLNSSAAGGFYSRIEAGSTGPLTLLVSQTKATITGENYTFSFFVNKDYTLPFLMVDTISANRSIFSLDSGSFVAVHPSVSKALVEDRGGYYFISLTFLTNSDSTRVGVMPVPTSAIGYTRDYEAGDYAEITAAQLEEGSYPTSYIPTAGSQVTRAADVSSSPQVTRAADSCVRTLGDEVNLDQWTICVSFTPLSVEYSGVLQSDNNNRLLYTLNSDKLRIFNGDNPIIGVIEKGVRTVVAISYNNGYVIVTQDGIKTAELEDYSLSISGMYFGKSGSGVKGSVIIEDTTYIPRALSEAELNAITGGN
jgi:hypothetical protein